MILGGALALLTLGFCAGIKHAPNPVVAQLHAHQDTVRDTIRVTEQRLRVDTVFAREKKAAAAVAHQAFDSAERAIAVIADTGSAIPTAIVMPALHVCAEALLADSISYAALEVSFADLAKHDRAETDRADSDEREMKIMKPPSLGFKSGFVAGILAAAGAVWLAKR